MGDKKLFGRVPHIDRIVHHKCFRVDMFQNMGRGDVRHVEGWVLAHQNHIHFREINEFRCAQRKVITLLGARREPGRAPEPCGHGN